MEAVSSRMPVSGEKDENSVKDTRLFFMGFAAHAQEASVVVTVFRYAL